MRVMRQDSSGAQTWWEDMPSTSERQRRFFGSELGRARAGEETETGMSEEKLRDFAKKPVARGSRRTRRRGRRR